jgi:hypothetical protein
MALSGDLTLTAKVGQGFRLDGSLSARPEAAGDPKISPSGALPPMAVRAKAEASVDFAQLPPGAHQLIGLPAPLPSAGTLKAVAAIALGTAKADARGGPPDDILALADLAPGARPDEWRAGARFHAIGIPMDKDYWLLSEIPFLSVVAAVLGGKPDEMSFVATSHGEVATHGRGLKGFESNLGGQGESRLDNFRVVGSPLLSLLAALTAKPAMKELTFERIDIPFSVRDESVVHHATLHYDEGAFIVKGTTGFDGKLDYWVTVQNPKGIGIIPPDLVGYFEAGKAAIIIRGTAQAPDRTSVV